MQPDEWVWLARIRRTQGRKGEVFANILTDFPEKFAGRRHLWLLASPPAQKPAASHPAQKTHAEKTAAPRPNPDPPETANPSASASALAPPREVELVHHWLHKGGIVLHFAGVDSITAAEALKGLTVAIPRSERTKLPEDETYISDLVGCLLVDVSSSAHREAAIPSRESGIIPDEHAPHEIPASREIGIIADVDRNAGPTPLLVIHSASGEILIPFAQAYLRSIDLDRKRVEMELPEGLIDLNA
jgi:16S rRNA processing protein RimM